MEQREFESKKKKISMMRKMSMTTLEDIPVPPIHREAGLGSQCWCNPRALEHRTPEERKPCQMRESATVNMCGVTTRGEMPFSRVVVFLKEVTEVFPPPHEQVSKHSTVIRG